MIKDNGKRKIINISLDLIIIAITLFAIIFTYFFGATGNMDGTGSQIFRYFTVLSNIYLVSMATFDLIFILKNNENIWIDLLRHSGVSMISITFIVVVVFLGPLISYKAMIEGTNLILHVISPLLAILLSILCFKKYCFNVKQSFISFIPLLVYAIIYFLMVVVFKTWPDFYSFNMNNMWIITVIIFIIFGIGLDLLYFKLNKLVNKNIIQ